MRRLEQLRQAIQARRISLHAKNRSDGVFSDEAAKITVSISYLETGEIAARIEGEFPQGVVVLMRPPGSADILPMFFSRGPLTNGALTATRIASHHNIFFTRTTDRKIVAHPGVEVFVEPYLELVVSPYLKVGHP